MGWTEDRVELLKLRWADGHTASQIAGELGGVTRNAVIGKVHRLGLTARKRKPRQHPPASRRYRRTTDAHTKDPRHLALSATAPHPDSLVPEGVPFADVDDDQCAFILDTGNCCGMPKANQSFCNFHYARTRQARAGAVVRISRPQRDEIVAAVHYGTGINVPTFEEDLYLPPPPATLLLPAPASNGHAHDAVPAERSASKGSAHTALVVSTTPSLGNLLAALGDYFGSTTASQPIAALFAVAGRHPALHAELESLLGAGAVADAASALRRATGPALPRNLLDALASMAMNCQCPADTQTLAAAVDGFVQQARAKPSVPAAPLPLPAPAPAAPPANVWPGELASRNRKTLTQDILSSTALCAGTSQAAMISESRKKNIARVRQTAAYLLRMLTKRSLNDIGQRLGGRDHTTILSAKRRIEELLLHGDDETRALITQVIKTLALLGHDVRPVLPELLCLIADDEPVSAPRLAERGDGQAINA